MAVWVVGCLVFDLLCAKVWRGKDKSMQNAETRRVFCMGVGNIESLELPYLQASRSPLLSKFNQNAGFSFFD